MLIDSTLDGELPAASALTRGLPRDQALGLRLMAMARAAAGMHLGQAAREDLRAQTVPEAQERAVGPQVLRSQASGLIEWMRRREIDGQDALPTRGMETEFPS